MRLSEERIEFINQQILDLLEAEGLISIQGQRSTVLVEMNRTVMIDLKREDEIDAEVEAMIRKMKRNIPEGSAEWNAIFLQKKEELAARYNYIL